MDDARGRSRWNCVDRSRFCALRRIHGECHVRFTEWQRVAPETDRWFELGPVMWGAVEILAVGWAVATALGIGFLVLRARHTKPSMPMTAFTSTDSASWPASPDASPLLPFASRQLDVEREFTAALTALRELAAQNLVELQVVIRPNLVVWTDPYALRHVLIEVLTQAIQRAAGGGVLLCANWHGGRVHTTITDDGAPGDPALLAAALRQVEQCIALQGGTLEITCSALRGNVVTLRLPGVGEPPVSVSDDAALEEPTVREALRRGVVRSAS